MNYVLRVLMWVGPVMLAHYGILLLREHLRNKRTVGNVVTVTCGCGRGFRFKLDLDSNWMPGTDRTMAELTIHRATCKDTDRVTTVEGKP